LSTKNFNLFSKISHEEPLMAAFCVTLRSKYLNWGFLRVPGIIASRGPADKNIRKIFPARILGLHE